MKVTLPYRLTRETMYQLLERVIDRDLFPKDKEIDFDFTSLSFIEPVGVTILSNLFEWLKKRDIRVIITYQSSISNDKWNPIKYLDDSMFFKRYTGRTLNDDARVRDTTIPLEIVTYANSYQWLDSSLMNWLSRTLNITKNSLTDIKMCLGEIFNNINDHAQENTGCIFAQHYPANNKVSIAISDFGVGIPNNIRKINPSLSDGEALGKAIEEGFTTKTNPRNLGVGLHTLVKNVVEHNKGSLFIHSNYGILNCISGDTNYTFSNEDSFYPGTLIEINLRTDTIFEIEEVEEEFEW